MNNIKVKSILDLEDKVDRMPLSNFIDKSDNSIIASLFECIVPGDLTVDWQLILTKVIAGLIEKNSFTNKKIFYTIFLELDYATINKNAISDVYNITQEPFDRNNFIQIQNTINLIKALALKYLTAQNEPAIIDDLINKFSVLINQLKDLEVVGIGGFTLAASLQLALLQEKAKTDNSQYLRIKKLTLDYIEYVKRINPRLYRLSVGRIDKICTCTKYKLEEVTEYECRYSDGKDIYVFRGHNEKVGYECNKHRLRMFQMIVKQVNQTVSLPVRAAVKKWQELVGEVNDGVGL